MTAPIAMPHQQETNTSSSVRPIRLSIRSARACDKWLRVILIPSPQAVAVRVILSARTAQRTHDESHATLCACFNTNPPDRRRSTSAGRAVAAALAIAAAMPQALGAMTRAARTPAAVARDDGPRAMAWVRPADHLRARDVRDPCRHDRKL